MVKYHKIRLQNYLDKSIRKFNVYGQKCKAQKGWEKARAMFTA